MGRDGWRMAQVAAVGLGLLMGPWLAGVTLGRAEPHGHATRGLAVQEVPDASEDSPTSSPVLAIKHVTIHTLEREGTLIDATVLIGDGKILAVGTHLEIPAGATVIEAPGFHLTPGLIDVRSRLFLGEVTADQSANDGSLNALDGVDRFHSLGHEVLASGVTAVYLQPASAGSWGGYGATLTTGAPPADGSGSLQAPAAAQMALGGGTRAGTSRARKQQFEALQKRLKDAQDYQKAWDDYRSALAKQAAADADKAATETPATGSPSPASPPAAGEGPAAGRPRRRPAPPDRAENAAEDVAGGRQGAGSSDIVDRQATATFQDPPAGPPSSSPSSSPQATAEAKGSDKKDAEPKKPAFDPLKERLLPLLRREMIVRFEAQQAEEIHWALQLASEFHLRLVLEGLGEMKSAAAAVAAAQVPVVLGPWLDLSGGTDPTAKCEQWAATFGGTAAANRLVIATFSPTPIGSKWLRAHAAAAVHYGLSREQALRGITLEAAQVAGVADRVGSVKVGKRADFVLFAGDPLDLSAPVALVVQNGRPVVNRMTEAGVVAGRDSPSLTAETAPGAVVKLPPRGSSRGPAAGAAANPERSSTYALVSQRVLLADGRWHPATVLVEAGVISQIGATVDLPAGVAVYDLGNHPLTPGMATAWYVNAATGAPFAKDSDAAQQFAADGFDPLRPAVKRLLKSGVTSLHLVNQPVNVVAGQTTWVRLGATSPGALGEPQRTVSAEQWVLTDAARNAERFPATLVGQVSMVRDRLRGGEVATTLYLPDSALQKLRQDRKSQLQAVQSGELPVLIAATSDGEIDAALRTIAGSTVRVWLYGPAQLRPFIGRLSEQQVGIIAPAITESQYDWYVEDLVAAHQAGVPILLAGDSGWGLRATAAALVARGIAPEAGLRMLMVDTVAAFNGQAAAGLTIGAPADILIWSGDPLDLTSRVLWNGRDN
jgi:imidazolonepropionase-like amidohydrolase